MKKTYLALLIGSALAWPVAAATAAEPDVAQNEQNSSTVSSKTAAKTSKKKKAASDDDKVEVIKVTGIRSSLKESQEIKKLADNVIDAIVAEDIGKFPDENVAEALQRIPGVSVTRSNGEGQTVTVRGLTGDYNITTLNGRKLASDNPSRDFNYDVIASELISGVQVHKTPQGHLPEGGIGAVVNVQTARPLDIGKFVMSGSLNSTYNERAESNDPRASFFISDTFNDDTFGALASITHSNYTNRHDSYQAWSFSERAVDIGRDGVVEHSAVRFPGYAQLTSYEDERTRTGGTMALQWRPANNIDVNFDALYSVYDIDSHGRQLSVVTYSESWLPAKNGVYTEVDVAPDGWANKLAWQGPALMDIVDTRAPRRNTTYQYGVNVNWVLDDLTYTFDISSSEAKNKNNGDNKYVVARSGVEAASINWANGQAVPDIILSEEVTPNSVFGAWYTNTDGTGVNDATQNAAFTGTWENDGLVSKVMFGAGLDSQEKERITHRSRNASIFAGENLAKINAPRSALVNFYGHEWWRLPSNALDAGNISNFMGDTKALIPANWATVNMDNLYKFLGELDPAAADLLKTDISKSQSFIIKEEIAHAFVEMNIEDEVFDMPYLLNLGLRYTRTDVASSGHSQNIHNLKFGADGKPVDNSWEAVQPVQEASDYDDILPSLNFKINLTDEVIFRTAASQVISRPSLNELAPYTYIDVKPNEQGVRYYETRTPGLKPYTADQFDTALEWYYHESGTVTFATFYKEVASFIKWDKTSETIDGQPFEVWKPYNDSSKTARIRGYELAFLQTFDDMLPDYLAGFGLQANYTYNDSVSGEKDDQGNEKPFRGLSKNQTNLVAFYENNKFEARIAYNNRSGYYAWDNWSVIGGVWVAEALHNNSTSWMDLGVSYDITDNITLRGDVANLQDKIDTRYLGDPSHIQYAATYGRRFSLGVRAKF
ncbi:TonB-dependent receptor [Rheinheimera sp. 4Y26]|uniref:TonB-dependent receptor n=1 Tax=Rheinheimera sp. 4Y26 TaxID=2977811 RepID=UPI0021B12862|nr:TonB-dependent receptor [Rheinheimera sp. 4Y26]MCT6698629.1 TonB-dependent receptor [Rheinheimera sp. 4Y26]